jgi:hypothetical protein
MSGKESRKGGEHGHQAEERCRAASSSRRNDYTQARRGMMGNSPTVLQGLAAY